MQQDDGDELSKNLTLALIYLSSWKEQEFEIETYRAWKGYDFSILDNLKEEGLIDFSYKAKSLYLSEEGLKKAKELVKKFSAL